MEPFINTHHGFIDKYIGDAIMALFPRSADSALAAAIAMLKELRIYNEHRKSQGYVPIRIGIGLNTGRLMLGTVGGKNRMDGTVISDDVNLASRIEGMTKMYGATLLISESTYSRLTNPNRYLIRIADRVAVKGKKKPITVYEIFDGDRPESLEAKKQTLPDYERAYELYCSQKFDEAITLFEKILSDNPDDIATKIYIDRCKKLQHRDVPKGWTEVTVLKEK
jgi:class 3 adenylate cyclase